MSARERQQCIRCDRYIETNESAVVCFIYCQTVGIKRRQKSKAERLYLCPQCAVVAAMGAKPGNGPLNVAAYRMIRGLVGSDPAVNEQAWKELNARLADVPALPAAPEPEILPPLKAAS